MDGNRKRDKNQDDAEEKKKKKWMDTPGQARKKKESKLTKCHGKKLIERKNGFRI